MCVHMIVCICVCVCVDVYVSSLFMFLYKLCEIGEEKIMCVWVISSCSVCIMCVYPEHISSEVLIPLLAPSDSTVEGCACV